MFFQLVAKIVTEPFRQSLFSPDKIVEKQDFDFSLQ
jgi:hypothetical protein